MTAIYNMKSAESDGVTRPVEAVTVRHARHRGPSRSFLAALTVAMCVCLCVMEVYHVRQCARLQSRISALDDRLEIVEALLLSATNYEGEGGLQRSRRSVVSASLKTSPAGIPVVDLPYGHRPQHQRPAHRLMSAYDDFMSDSSSRASEGDDGSSIRPHHRSSAAFSSSRLGRVNSEIGDHSSTPSVPPAGASQVAAALRSPPAASRPSRRPEYGMAHRRSRVPVSRRRKGRLRSISQKRSGRKHRHKGSRRELESRGAPLRYAPPPKQLRDGDGERSRSSGGHHCRRKRLIKMMRDELSATAAHFEGHTSNYTTHRHPHYGGNGRLRNIHDDHVFKDWRPAAWMRQEGFHGDFSLHRGRVAVKHAGVYYVYAQINYQDDRDSNAFEILVNNQPVAKCVTMEASHKIPKVNTCHTGATTYLSAGDSVMVRDLERGWISMFLPDRSFFGLIKLAGTGTPGHHRCHGENQF